MFIRIIFNGLQDCLNRDRIPAEQRPNTLHQDSETPEDIVALYARITRAVASAYTHAVTLTEQGIRLNYLLPGRTLAMIRKTPVIILTDKDTVMLQSNTPASGSVSLFIPRTETGAVILKHSLKETTLHSGESGRETGFYIHMQEEWQNGDGFRFKEDGKILCEETHHQGICFFDRNRLMTLKANVNCYDFAVTEAPIITDCGTRIKIRHASGWKMKKNEPADIPVMPAAGEETEEAVMIPYAENPCRITVFPRTKDACLK